MMEEYGVTEKKYKLYDVGSSYMTQCGVKSNDDCFENMAECCDELNRLADKNEQLKKVLDTHLNKSYVELNKFKSLKNPSNPERVRKQIIIRDAEIMLLLRILKEIDSSKSVNTLMEENEQLKMENNELKLLVQNWEALDEEKDEQLDKQNQALKKLKKENSNLRFEMSMYEQKIEDLEKELIE